MSERDDNNDDARRRRRRLDLFETWVKHHVQQQRSAGAVTSIKSFPIYVKTEHLALLTSDDGGTDGGAPVPFVSAKAVGALSVDIGETFYDAAVRTLGAATVRALVDGGWLADPATAARQGSLPEAVTAAPALDENKIGGDGGGEAGGEKQDKRADAGEGSVAAYRFVAKTRDALRQVRRGVTGPVHLDGLRFDLYRRVFIDGADSGAGGAVTQERLLALSNEMPSSELYHLVDVLRWMADRAESRKLRRYAVADIDAPASDSERIAGRHVALRAFRALYAASPDGNIDSAALDAARRAGAPAGVAVPTGALSEGGDGSADGDAVVKAMIVAGREAGAAVKDVRRAADVRARREKGARSALSASIIRPATEGAEETATAAAAAPHLPPLVPLEGAAACPACGKKKKYAPGEGRVACAHCGGRKGALATQPDAAPTAEESSDSDGDGEGTMACAHCGGSGKVPVRKPVRALEGASACHHTLRPLYDDGDDATHETLERGQTLSSAEGATSCATCRHHVLHPLDEVPADVVKATGNVVSETGAAVGSAVGKTVAAIQSPFS